MNTGYEIFSRLAEDFLAEASTSMDVVKSHPGGAQVVQALHKDFKLGHDMAYTPIPKIAWSDLKDSYRGAWVILVGTKGTGAIKASGGNTGDYDALTSSGEAPQHLRNSRGGNILDFIKGNIGQIRSYYMAKNTQAVTDKQRKRKDNQPSAATPVASQETIVTKFRPLWLKAMQAAMADIKGMAANMIKNDAFHKAEKKLNMLKNLENSIFELQNGSKDTPGQVKNAIHIAIMMTAAHYYPDQTGDIQRSHYGSGYSTQHSEGTAQVLKDIGAGDQKKLGTLLAFFKRSLISG